MKHLKPQAGFSLVDMIMGLSIIAVAIVGIQIAQNNYVNMSSRTEVRLRAISVGNSVMNVIRMHRFDENSNAPWDSTWGTNTGETSMALYDDIDDYAGAVWDFSADGINGYSITSRVFSVNIASSWLDSVAYFTSFKRIIVQVSHPILDSPVIFTSLMAGIDE